MIECDYCFSLELVEIKRDADEEGREYVIYLCKDCGEETFLYV